MTFCNEMTIEPLDFMILDEVKTRYVWSLIEN